MRKMKDSGIEWIGEIPAEWQVCKIKNTFNIYSGATPKSGNSDYWDGDVVWITPADYKTIDKYIGLGKRTLTQDGYNSCGTTLVPENSIIFSKRAPIGSVAISKIPLCTNQGCLACVSKGSADFVFYYYVMSVFTEIFGLYGSGTTFKEISFDNFASFYIPYPDVKEQKEIADYLDHKCAEIDAVIEKTKATIEEYKKLKQSVITEAVTKGIRGNRPMRDSGIEWIGDIPAEWNIQKGKWLLKRLERPVQSTDEVITCFRDGEVTLRSNRREDGFTFSLQEAGYQGIEPGDLVVHGMDGFAGAIGISDSRGKGTPVLNVMDCTESKRYIMYYLRNMAYNGIFLALATGIRVRSCDTNWNKLKELPYLLPSIEEQKEIADFIDKRCTEIDVVIAQKNTLLSELETYKNSLIYEYITGKKEVGEVSDTTTVAIVYPYFPAVLSTDRARFAQAVLMSKILDSNVKYMGRVKLEKMLFTIEHSIGFDFDTDYARQKAGPLDGSIYECEKIVSRTNKWFYVNKSQYGTSYKPQKNMGKYKRYYEQYFSDYNEEIEGIISVFENYSLDQSEIVATLFAAWNDAIIDNKPFTDEDVVNDVLNNWHESKTRFSKDMWLRAMDGMRKNNLVPKGYGKKTVIKN